MSNSNNDIKTVQKLFVERDRLKQKLLDSLTELYFLRNNGLMCDYHIWTTKEQYSSIISNTKDEDLISDQRFSKLLNLQLFDESPNKLQQQQQQQQQHQQPTTPSQPQPQLQQQSTSTSQQQQPQSPKTQTDSQPQTTSIATTATTTHAPLPATTTPATAAASAATTSLPQADHANATAPATTTISTTPATTTTTSLPKPETVAAAASATAAAVAAAATAATTVPSIPQTEPTITTATNTSSTATTTATATSSAPALTNDAVSGSGKDSAKRKRSLSQERDSESQASTIISKNDDGISPPPEKKICDESLRLESDNSAKQPIDLLGPQNQSLQQQQQQTNSINSCSQDIVIDADKLVRDRKPRATPSKDESLKVIETDVSQKQHDSSITTANSTITRTESSTPVPTAPSTFEKIVERAKHEAAVTERIAELRKLGLWSARRLPKLQDPPRPKTHWDYLLEEMRWLSTDFESERKWKRKTAKKCAYMVYRYHQEKRLKEERQEKEKLQSIKRIAASQAKEIRSFWQSIEKIVDFRQQTKLEETRKKAMGLHLNYILDQTSKFSNTFLEDTKPTITKEENIDYPNNQEGEKTEKEPVINNEEQNKSKHNKVDDMAAGAESIQPKGYTLETATVSTKVPFLLKHQLREYQHIGLDWLVAMYKKQLNGMLADEMGLGKTIQTIALLAHLACEEQDWGPHLIVVPTSVMLNWEMEFKKWCPAFKILTYYGNPKERKMKRVGWSRPNSFHVCITSYRIVIQDHAAFRRKQWSYFILDEAHYIKNFKSQRWQTLLNFNSQRRLLLTGTPLQNDLMELWSLMHFLMPSLFDSYREFKDWFVNPLTGMIEGSHEYNQELVTRLHKILRPFLLRRLKADVEKQLPSKKEIIKYCRLSKRQRFLYEEFMSLSKTKETLASGNFLSVINVLMQLRKVCNHPNLFEPRPTISPFMMKCIAYKVPGLLTTPLDYNPDDDVNLDDLQLHLANNSVAFSSSAYHFLRSKGCTYDQIVQEANIDTASDVSSQTTETGSVQEIDEAMVAMNNTRIADAYASIKEARRKEKLYRLKSVSIVNDFRCGKINALYFNDLQDCINLNNLRNLNNSSSVNNIFTTGNARILCSAMEEVRSKPKYRIQHLSSLLDESVRSPEQVCEQMSDIIKRYVFCVPSASAPPVSMHVSHHSPSKKVRESFIQKALYEELSPRSDFLHKIVVNMRTCFPELRLIEYDCGKLQALSRLLTELKSNDHRVLIFTQMSRMLDILEQFLNYHGHTYLRLDGATRIDQRQIMMERFNNDKRIFCFILSTRSGGIGVNLTGADTVIFYDSDWNPTMDAQAQDRCHRIGQTRDVHIYRLISEDTIEQNIYRKAQQKRMLGDLAIEEGNFGTSCFKKSSIQELFEATKAPAEEVENVIEMDDQQSEMTNAQLSKLEQALSKGEAEAGEDMDVDAIKVARADVDTDLREFDENIPLTEESSPVEKSEKEQQIDTIVSQMTPVEQYAVRFLESLQKPKNKEELEQAEREYRLELENKKSQWEQSRIEQLKEQSTKNDLNGTLLTYPKGTKCEHVQFLLDGERKLEEMPIWAPPTPPTSPPSPVEESSQHHYQPAMTPAMAARISAMGGLGNIFGFGSDSHRSDTRHYINEKDLYVDYTLHFLYEPNVMPESQLPAINQHYTDSEATSYTIGSKKIRLTGTPVVPGGYFQTSSQMPLLQQHLRNLTNVPTTPDGSGSGLIGQQAPRKPKVRRDEVICLPKSIFDRITPNFAKIRRELKLQKLRCVTKGNDSDPFAMQKFFHSFSLNPLGQSLQQETIVNTVNRQIQQYNNPNFLLGYYQERLPPWSLQEEWALLMVIQHLQDLPVNLCILTPGHTPNWELVSEVVSDIGFTYRSFKMCEYHFALNVQKREMTRNSSWEERALPAVQSESLPSPSKKSKKQKTMSGAGTQSQSTSGVDGQSSQSTASSIKSSSLTPAVPFKASKTGAMLAHDKSLQFSFKERYEIIKQIHANRPKPVIPRCTSKERPSSNPTLFRDDKRLIDYDRPLRPEVIVMERRPPPRPAVATHPGHMVPQQPQCGCCLPSTGATTTPR